MEELLKFCEKPFVALISLIVIAFVGLLLVAAGYALLPVTVVAGFVALMVLLWRWSAGSREELRGAMEQWVLKMKHNKCELFCLAVLYLLLLILFAAIVITVLTVLTAESQQFFILIFAAVLVVLLVQVLVGIRAVKNRFRG